MRRQIKRHSKRPLPRLKKEAWDAYSLLRRFSAAKHNGSIQCISCSKWIHWKDSQLGHFHHNVLDFHPINTNPQCGQCNGFKKGNARGYARWLANTYGADVFDKLLEDKRKGRIAKYSRSDYELMIAEFKAKAIKLGYK